MNKTEFTHIYKSHYTILFKYLYKLSKCEDSAKDICQEAFMKLYIELNAAKDIEFIKSWLFKCAHNNFLNRVKRNQIINFEQYSSKNELSDEHNPEDKYIKTEKSRNLELAVNKLSDSEKQLIYLYQEDFSYAEISEITGIKVTSVGKTLSRTIEKVSKHLQKTKSYELL